MPSFRFTFRPLAEEDLPLLREWLSRPHLQERWWEGEVSLDGLRERYLPRIAGADAARPFVALLDGEPAGYIQAYDASAGPAWWPDRPGPGVVGIDQFLADGDRLGRGLGTAMVSAFVARLLEDPEVTEVRVDPRPDNLRAIRCYAKVGFREVGSITTPDGPALMMVLERARRAVSIVPASAGDAPALTELATRSKAHWPYPEEWLAEWRPQLRITEELVASAAVFVARRGSTSLGFYALAITGRTASLEHLWVDPSAMRQGIGRALFEHARDRAGQLGCEILRIDSDPHAEPFYLAMGAARVGTVPAPVAGHRRELPRLQIRCTARVESGP